MHGSGFIVSPDGYIVTNSHVVLGDSNPRNMIAQRFAMSQRQALRRTFAKRYQIPADERRQIAEILFRNLISYFAEYGSIQGVSTDFNVLNGVATPDDDIEVDSWTATVKQQGTVRETVGGAVTWSRDVAILKIPQRNLPTVELGEAPGQTAEG